MIKLKTTIAFLLAASSSFLMAQQRGLKVVTTDPLSGEQIELYQDSRALLVGINKYQNVTQLGYAVADAESMRTLLVRKFGFKPNRVNVLTDAKATKKSIMAAFADLLETSPNDRVIVFYAGHGTQTDLPGGGEMGYLIPVDGKAKSKSELYSTCISMEELKNVSKQIPAKHVLFLVDACYGGLAAVTSRAMTLETKLYVQKIAVAQARQVITAGGRGEVVVEKAEWGHSAFTKALLDGLGKELADLDGNGLITASELASYLKPKVTASSENKQTPQFKSFTDDEGDFMFVLEGRPASKPRPVVQEAAREIRKEEPVPASSEPASVFPQTGSGLWKDIRVGVVLSLPMGELASTATSGNSGFAKTGFGGSVEYGMGIVRGFGFAVGGQFNTHSVDAATLASQLGTGISVDAGSWTLIWLTAGPAFNLEISEGTRIYGVGRLGLLFGSSPAFTISTTSASGKQNSSSGSAFGYGISAGVIFGGNFDVGLGFLSAEPEYSATGRALNGNAFTTTFKQPSTIFQIGVGYRIGL